MSAEQPHANLFEVTRIEGVTVVRFSRRTILDPDLVEALGNRLTDLARAEKCQQVVLNLGMVESLTSAMLGKFASLHQIISATGGQVACCHVGDFLRTIFILCRFPESIPIFPDEATAIQALREIAPRT
ncbi:MAG: STAS domain-containing protein [Gemmataceae bacterium]